MNTVCQTCVCVPMPQRQQVTTIQRWVAVTRRLWADLKAARPTRLSESELTALDGLSTQVLKDIGAPEWVQEQAQRRHERARQGGLFERDSLYWR